MLPYHLFVRRNVYAVDFIAGHIAMDPLDTWAHLLEHSARGLRDPLQLLRRQVADAWNLPLDYVLRHTVLLPEKFLKRYAQQSLTTPPQASASRVMCDV